MNETPASPVRISGRRFVPVLLGLLLLTFGVMLVLWSRGPKGRFAEDASGSAKIRMEATCVSSEGTRVSAAWKGRCSQGDTVELSVTEATPGPAHVLWTVFGPGGVRFAHGGAAPTFDARIPLALPSGPYMLAGLASEEPIPAELLGFSADGVNPVKGLDALERAATAQRRQGRTATVVRLPIQLDAPVGK